jgi:hypothetical protein
LWHEDEVCITTKLLLVIAGDREAVHDGESSDTVAPFRFKPRTGELKIRVSTAWNAKERASETPACPRVLALTARPAVQCRSLATEQPAAASSARSIHVAVLGAAGGIGQPLSLLLKLWVDNLPSTMAWLLVCLSALAVEC